MESVAKATSGRVKKNAPTSLTLGEMADAPEPPATLAVIAFGHRLQLMLSSSGTLGCG